MRKEKCVIVWLMEGWLSCLGFFCVPSEIAIQDEVFKLPAWLWLVIIFLSSILHLFPFAVAQSLLSASVCECKDITQLLCTQAYGKLHLPTASGSYILWQWQLPVVQAGRLMFTLPLNLWGNKGRHFVYINTLMRFFLYRCLARVEVMVGYLPVSVWWPRLCESNQMWPLLQQPLPGTQLLHPISPPEQGFNQKK